MLNLDDSRIQGIGMTSQRTRDRLVQRLRDEGIKNDMVLDVIRTLPRHLFVDEAMAHRAYEDTALPINHGQTISQPYIVARMTELILQNGVPETVLEVGTGSGYQAAVLSRLVPRVFSVERIAALLNQARERFTRLRFDNVSLKHTDGSWGWPEYGPYPAIIVTAAPSEVPEALLQQLAEGGVMVIPVGGQTESQRLLVITRQGDDFERQELDAVRFVPLLGGAER